MKKLFLLILIGFLSFQTYAQPSTYLQKLNEKYTSGLFKSDDAHVLVPMDDNTAAAAFNVFQYMQGRVPGFSVYQNFLQRPVIRYRFGSPALFLDEVRVDAATLSYMNMNDIALIKVFRPPFFGAIGGGPNGAIAVYTKDGDEEGTDEIVSGE